MEGARGGRWAPGPLPTAPVINYWGTGKGEAREEKKFSSPGQGLGVPSVQEAGTIAGGQGAGLRAPGMGTMGAHTGAKPKPLTADRGGKSIRAQWTGLTKGGNRRSRRAREPTNPHPPHNAAWLAEISGPAPALFEIGFVGERTRT